MGPDVSLRLLDADDQGDAVLDPDKIFSQKVLGDLAGVPVGQRVGELHGASSFHSMAVGGASSPHRAARQVEPW